MRRRRRIANDRLVAEFDRLTTACEHRQIARFDVRGGRDVRRSGRTDRELGNLREHLGIATSRQLGAAVLKLVDWLKSYYALLITEPDPSRVASIARVYRSELGDFSSPNGRGAKQNQALVTTFPNISVSLASASAGNSLIASSLVFPHLALTNRLDKNSAIKVLDDDLSLGPNTFQGVSAILSATRETHSVASYQYWKTQVPSSVQNEYMRPEGMVLLSRKTSNYKNPSGQIPKVTGDPLRSLEHWLTIDATRQIDVIAPPERTKDLPYSYQNILAYAIQPSPPTYGYLLDPRKSAADLYQGALRIHGDYRKYVEVVAKQRMRDIQADVVHALRTPKRGVTLPQREIAVVSSPDTFNDIVQSLQPFLERQQAKTIAAATAIIKERISALRDEQEQDTLLSSIQQLATVSLTLLGPEGAAFAVPLTALQALGNPLDRVTTKLYWWLRRR